MVTVNCTLSDLKDMMVEVVNEVLRRREASQDTMDSSEVMSFLKISRVTLWRLGREQKDKDGNVVKPAMLVPLRSENGKHLYARRDVEAFVGMK